MNAKHFYMLMALGVALFAISSPIRASDLIGHARVIDGDTIEVSKQRIRLFGIDAPEGKQSCTLKGKPWDCGQEAKRVLEAELVGQTVSCQQRDIDRYRRIVGVCFVGQQNINAVMVRKGWALAYRSFSKDYVPQEADAQREGLGIWQSKFETPWDWRRHSR